MSIIYKNLIALYHLLSVSYILYIFLPKIYIAEIA
jgi:hypothetical protein